MKKILMQLLLACAFLQVNAQTKYTAADIPKNLLPYASAVIRNKETTVEVKGLDNTTYHIKECITVLNKNGDDLARIVIWHNKSNVIKSVKGVVYDEYGKPTSKFSESNFSDVNASNDFSLFEDSRVKHYIPTVLSYPYTIEYEYEVKSKQSLNFHDWKPQPEAGLAVEKSTFTFICKPDFNIKFKQINFAPTPIVTNLDKNTKTYTWSTSNLPAIKDEPYSPNPATYEPCVKVAPQKFMYEGIEGTFDNWYELGKWVYDKLLVNRDKLNQPTIDMVKNLTKDITDPKEKARKLYEYLQSKTRYISIQIGIGGYQPFLASEVDRLGYGDCKALVNYMHALLKAIDIESFYCVVEAGDEKTSLLSDFASMDQGNHIILCVPFKNDTTWLECTNQKLPFGYLGDFTDNRTVLACTAQGGKLLNTPKYGMAQSTQIRNATFIITEKGELKGDMKTSFKGAQYENRESLMEESPAEQVKALKHIYPVNNLEIDKFSIKQDKAAKSPETTEALNIYARDYAAIEPNKIKFMLNPVNRTSNAPRELRNRIKPMFIANGYTDIDDVVFTIPANYKTEKLPLDVELKAPFGFYKATMKISGNTLTYRREIQLKDGTYDKENYQELVDFYKKVSAADNYDVSLLKK